MIYLYTTLKSRCTTLKHIRTYEISLYRGEEVIATLWKECIENNDKFDQVRMASATTATVIALTNVKPSSYGGA